MHDVKVFLIGLLFGVVGTAISVFFIIKNNKSKAQAELDKVKPN
jgi:hypothetical protein